MLVAAMAKRRRKLKPMAKAIDLCSSSLQQCLDYSCFEFHQLSHGRLNLESKQKGKGCFVAILTIFVNAIWSASLLVLTNYTSGGSPSHLH